MNENKNPYPTILRGYVVLERVVKADRPISAAELVDELSLPKPTMHRILQQLETEGLVQREPISRRYFPGPRVQRFAYDVVSNKGLGAARHAILQALSEEIGETCNCTMLDTNTAIYFDRVETNWPLRIHFPVGTHVPLHCTASGKLFLSHMPARQRKRLIASAPLKRHTERTITDPELLTEQLKSIEADAVGVDDEEFLAGMVALAVPVSFNAKEFCFTVAVHAPTARKPLEHLRQYLPSLRKAAAAMVSAYGQ